MSIPQDYVSVDLETTGLNPKNRQDHRNRHGDRAKWPGGAGVFHFSQSLPAASARDGGTDRNPG